jgi:hypothetical protein
MMMMKQMHVTIALRYDAALNRRSSASLAVANTPHARCTALGGKPRNLMGATECVNTAQAAYILAWNPAANTPSNHSTACIVHLAVSHLDYNPDHNIRSRKRPKELRRQQHVSSERHSWPGLLTSAIR